MIAHLWLCLVLVGRFGEIPDKTVGFYPEVGLISIPGRRVSAV
jgi:hypothetical protein